MSRAKPEPPDRVGPWDRLLEVAVVLVGVSGAVFVVAGTLTTSLFEWIVFGSAESPIPVGAAARYVTFVYGVLGAVMVGWACLLWPLVRGPIRRRESWAWSAIAASVGVWFVVDSTLSLASGFGENALLNLVFAIAFAVPLLAIRRDGLSS
jgi:hypothetical protein